MDQLVLLFLGSFAVHLAGRPLTTLGTDKTRALLAYLALEPPQPHARRQLAALLWPEVPERQARQSLRTALYRLRQSLDLASDIPLSQHVLTLTPQTVQWHPTDTPIVVRCDVEQFRTGVAAAQSHRHEALAGCASCVEQLTQAAQLYRGAFLADVSVGDASGFEDWALLHRERLHQQALYTFEHLARAFEDRGNGEQASDYALQLLALEPYREVAHRLVMRLLARRGLPDQALAHYASCRQRLLDELGVEPEAETVALAEQIRRGDWGAAPEPQPAARPIPLHPPTPPEAPRTSQTPSPPLSPVSLPSGGTERRPLTVLSCRLANADTQLSQLDPEWLYDVWAHFEAIVARFGGYVAHQGDVGLLVYFGYPLAHEEAAPQAVRSALALLAGLGDLATGEAPSAPLAVQVGIHTGTVIIDPAQAGEVAPPLAVGVARRMAEQLATLTRPHSVAISAATAALVAGYFECKALGRYPLAGDPEPGMVYEVRGESGLQTRLDVGLSRGLTPFVGRQSEVALLDERWRQVQDGVGQVVVIQGEAGIGKSRLLQVFKARLAAEQAPPLECRCAAQYQHSAFYPLIDLLRRWVQSLPTMAETETVERLASWLDEHGFPLDETLLLLADLLSLPLPPGRDASLPWTPQEQRQRTLETLVEVVLSQAANAPQVLMVEDLHWSDPSTQEFLERLSQRVAGSALLVLLTSRPGHELPWLTSVPLSQVLLHRLNVPQIDELIGHVTGGKSLPAEVHQHLVAKSDGVPLYVEEMTRMILESGQLRETPSGYELSGALGDLSIPSTLHDSLLARLDRLGVGKTVAQWGAVLGRTFNRALLSAVVPLEPETLGQELRHLVEAELLFQQGLGERAHYRFKHALIQDAAYDSLLRRRRQAMHGQVAEVLEAHFPQLVEAEPEVLAHHYTEAQCPEQAIPYWQRAGQQALQRSAHAEAMAHLTQGLTLLRTLPETPARRRQELDLQVALGPALIAIKGNGAPEVERAYARARELCQHVDDAPQVFPVLRGLMTYYQTLGHMQTTTHLGEQLLRLAQAQPDPAPCMLAHYQLGMALFLRGELAASQTHHTQALALYTPQAHRALAVRHGVDFGVASGDFLAWELWSLGFPDQALQRSQAARALAQEVVHPYSLGHALLYAAILYQRRREAPAAQEQAEAAATLATDQGFAYYLARAMVVHGWALAMQGERETGIAEIRQGLARLQALGDKAFHPYALGLLAESHGVNGCPEAGLEALAEAMTVMDTTEVRFYAAELYRLKGVLLLQQAAPDAPQAEVCSHHALDIARQQQARSWELRAATSLAHLWQHQGKHQDAYDLLAPVYEWFTEGFDTADLTEARALLDELR